MMARLCILACKRLIISVLTVAFIMLGNVDVNAQRRKVNGSKPRTSSTVRKDQQNVRESIKLTNKKIKDNESKTRASLNQLNLINAEIAQLDRDMKMLNRSIDSITIVSNNLNDTVVMLDRRVDAMKQAYAKSIRATTTNQSQHLSRLAFLFASESFTQAYRRMRYLNEFSAWQARQGDEIRAKKAVLALRKAELDSAKTLLTVNADSLQRAHRVLDARKHDADVLVKSLKKQNKTLQKVLKDNEDKVKALDKELSRVIAEEQAKAAKEAETARRKAEEARRAAEKKTQSKSDANGNVSKPQLPKTEPKSSAPVGPTGGSFAEHKGRLPFPVNGQARIVRGFGKQQHPQLQKVTINNSGIDIETTKGASAHAVFDGKVSAIFKQQGFNNIVMVRHGEYLTIYANLAKISVKNGDNVTQGQSIGVISSDANDNNRTILHFELRHEKDKLDPTLWLRQR